MSTRTRDFFAYGMLGALISYLSFTAHAWLRVDGHSFDDQPHWIKIARRALDLLPWVIGGALLLFALQRGRLMPFLAFAGIQVAVIVAVFGWLILGPLIRDYSSRTSFDSERWKAADVDHGDPTRGRMVDDLLRTHDLVGMPRAELERLLGAAPRTDYFSGYDHVYWLGPERGFISIDSEWLVVKCDHDVVVEARLARD